MGRLLFSFEHTDGDQGTSNVAYPILGTISRRKQHSVMTDGLVNPKT